MSTPLDSADDGLRIVHYRLSFRPRGAWPGAHPALGEGGDGTFRGLLPLVARPDPRRIDLRASLRDPFQTVQVRSFAPRRTATVALLLDASASLGFGSLRGEVAALASTLATSAIAAGDAFALAGADATVREDLFVPASRRRGLPEDVRARILGAPLRGRGAGGLAEAAARLPQRRSLVFLVSDFFLPEPVIHAALDALWRHDVVPVIARDSRAEGDLPAFGLMEVRDAETGAPRLMLLRPALRARWQAQARARITALDALFAARGFPAFHLLNRFDPDALIHYLARR